MAKKKKVKDIEEKMSEKETVEEVEEVAEEPDLSGEAETGEQQEEQEPSQIIAGLEEEKRACEEKMLRMAADLENFKKRMARERSTALKYAEENLLKEWGGAMSDEQLDKLKYLERKEKEKFGKTKSYIGLEDVDLVK